MQSVPFEAEEPNGTYYEYDRNLKATQRYGGQHVKRAIERHVVSPLANLLATDQVHLGDLVCIDWDHSRDCLTFIREGDDLAMPARCLEPAAPVRSVPARTGKFVEGPAVTLTPESSPCVA
jgi:hypothetical protein